MSKSFTGACTKQSKNRTTSEVFSAGGIVTFPISTVDILLGPQYDTDASLVK